MMPRVFFDDHVVFGENVSITGEQAHHFARVLRAQPGEQVVIVTPMQSYLAKIVRIDSKSGSVEFDLLREMSTHEPSVCIHVVQGIAKGEKMESIIQKCTEVGVVELIAYAADRSVVQLGAKSMAKISRWQKIAQEAAGQAQRDRIPTIQYAESLSSLQKFCQISSLWRVLLLDEMEALKGLKSVLKSFRQSVSVTDFVILVGPEGGWSDRERTFFQEQMSAWPVSLGPRILRTETAGVVTSSIILYEYDEMGG